MFALGRLRRRANTLLALALIRWLSSNRLLGVGLLDRRLPHSIRRFFLSRWLLEIASNCFWSTRQFLLWMALSTISRSSEPEAEEWRSHNAPALRRSSKTSRD